MKYKEGDMHCHSYWSDGFDSPRLIAHLAHYLGYKFMVLTDHDTVRGLREFIAECRKLGINVMTGIEISTMYKGTYFHVLGYNFNLETMEDILKVPLPGYTELKSLSERILLYLLDKYRIEPVSIGRIKDHFALPGHVSFMHVMDYVSRRIGKTLKEIKDEIFSGDRFWTPPDNMPHPSYAIDIIRRAGGVASLAHPEAFLADKYGKAEGRVILEELLDELKTRGLFAIEAYNGKNSPEQIEYYLRLAHKYGLFLSAGSDYHGRYKEGVPLGAKGMDYDDFLKFKKAA